LTRRAAAAPLALALLCGIAACARRPPADSLALVNAEPITARDLARELKLLGMENADEPSRGQVLEEMIDQALVLQEAARLGATLSREELENQLALARAGTPLKEFSASLEARGIPFAEWRERVRRRALCDEVVRREIRSGIVVKPQDLKDYYWEHVTRFRRSESLKLRQILCNGRGPAEKALAELRLGDPFAAVAVRYSEAPEASEGGDLGWVEQKALPQKLEKAAFALKPGQYSPIIATRYGWHILFCEARRGPEAFSLDQSAPQILEALLREREQPLYRDWLASLRGRADIRRGDSIKGKP
jgi:peptidyl-prolyl cis-trans isomerase SurA